MERKLISGVLIASTLFWLMLIGVIVLIAVGSFVVPSMVPTWKAQGLTETPLFWQILIDCSDFAKSNWFVVLPGLFVAALVATYFAIRDKRRVPENV
ncbi:MAG TPA: hypothetical protein VKU00_16170 [Chthonomonadaceae bacterium]|nr:hypothetical protein [Chthonomonadaceae bacterium]